MGLKDKLTRAEAVDRLQGILVNLKYYSPSRVILFHKIKKQYHIEELTAPIEVLLDEVTKLERETVRASDSFVELHSRLDTAKTQNFRLRNRLNSQKEQLDDITKKCKFYEDFLATILQGESIVDPSLIFNRLTAAESHCEQLLLAMDNIHKEYPLCNFCSGKNGCINVGWRNCPTWKFMFNEGRK